MAERQFKQIVNIKSGKTQKVPLSDEEQAKWEANVAAHESTRMPRAKNNKIRQVKNKKKEIEENAFVTISVNNISYDWKADRNSRDDIVSILTAINSGIDIPNPKDWTPKNSTKSVSCSHDDLKNIAEAIINKLDEIHHYASLHEHNIKATRDESVLDVYNIKDGWP